MIIEWKDEYLLGIPTIDAHHRHFVVLMNKLFEARYNEDPLQGILAVIGELDDYAKYHFSYEEKLFAEMGYLGADAHHASHCKFVKNLEEYHEQVKAGLIPKANLMLNGMNDWLLNHILNEDKMFAKFFSSKKTVK